MNKRKKGLRITVVIVTLLAVAAAFLFFHGRSSGDAGGNVPSATSGSKTEVLTQQTLKHGQLPVLSAPSVYVGQIDDMRLALFLESSDSSQLKGHYLILDGDNPSDTVAFSVVPNGRRFIISEKRSRNVRLFSLATGQNTIDVVYGRNVFSKSSFHLERYVAPAFADHSNRLYQQPLFDVEETDDLLFAQVVGYWSELEKTDDVGEYLKMLSKTTKERDLDLYMDVFTPKGDTLRKHPLVMLIHGGAFYFGTRKDIAVRKWCQHLASMGYVTASIDYRIGFKPVQNSIERSGYMAVQDASAALRFLVGNQDVFHIDTSMIIVGGSSAGSITALNLAYMTDDNRPKTSRQGFMREDLGPIDVNDFAHDYTIKCVVDMWGALTDINMLNNARIPILAFHGNKDDIVPYGYDYPIAKAGGAKRALFEKMYGSSCIVQKAHDLGIDAKLYTFEGYGHAPHLGANDSLNENFYFIQNAMPEFFYHLMKPDEPTIVCKDGHYSLQADFPVDSLCWQAEGGLILEEAGDSVRVQWIGNAQVRKLRASGFLPHGIGFTENNSVGASVN